MGTITIPQRIRSFQKVGRGNVLGRTGYHFEAGDLLEIGDPEIVTYDHKDQVAVPVLFDNQTYYLLMDEFGPVSPKPH